MARIFLILLGLIAVAGGAVELYVGGSHTRAVMRHLDAQLAQAARNLPTVLENDPALALAREASQSQAFRETMRELERGGGTPGRQVLAAATIAVDAVASREDPVVLVGNENGFSALHKGEEVAVDPAAAEAFFEEALWKGEKQGFIEVRGRLHRLVGVAVGRAGVLAVALPVSEAYARKVGDTLGVDVVFVQGGKVLASSLAIGESVGLVDAGAGRDGAFAAGTLPERFSLLGKVQLPLFIEEASAFRARGIDLPGGLRAVIAARTTELLQPIAAGQVRLLVGAVAVFLLALLFAMVTRGGRPGAGKLSHLADLAERAAEGDPTATAPEYLPGDLGRLSRAINRLATRTPKRPTTDSISSLLSEPEEPPQDLTGAFPLGDHGAESAEANEEEAEPLLGSSLASEEEADGPSIFDPPPLPEGAGSSYFEDLAAGKESDADAEPEPLAAASVNDGELAAAQMGGFGGQEADDAAVQQGADEAGQEQGTGWDEPTRPLQASAAWMQPPGGEPSDSTMVGQVPDELLRATGKGGAQKGPVGVAAVPAAGVAAAPPATDAGEEEAHLREVFESFIATRQQCGEPSEGITFDRFAAKLRANRAQLLEKYQCRTVRFSVYVKEGKAALRATPIR